MEEKEKELLNAQNAAEEVSEEITEEVNEEAVDDALEEVSEETEQEFEEVPEEADECTEAKKYVDIEKLAKQVKSLKIKNMILSLLLAVIIVAAVVFTGVKAYMNYNPYNNLGYPNTSGLTLEDYAKFNGITVDEIKAELKLPDDVKANTYLDVIDYIIPFAVIAENYGVDVDTAKQMFQVADTVTGETPFGEAMDTVPLSAYVGTGDVLTEFIEEYNLPDTVTEDTLWGEVRRKVLKIQYDRANAPKEEKEEEVVEETPQPQNSNSQEISEEELAEILEYIENSTNVE